MSQKRSWGYFLKQVCSEIGNFYASLQEKSDFWRKLTGKNWRWKKVRKSASPHLNFWPFRSLWKWLVQEKRVHKRLSCGENFLLKILRPHPPLNRKSPVQEKRVRKRLSCKNFLNLSRRTTPNFFCWVRPLTSFFRNTPLLLSLPYLNHTRFYSILPLPQY